MSNHPSWKNTRHASKKKRNHLKKKRFSPWREDFIAAFAIGLLSIVALYKGLASGTIGETVFGLVIGIGGGMIATWAWKNGMRRWYGKHLERWAIERLGTHLKRKKLEWQAGWMVSGLGDADVLVYTSPAPVVIEIKSFQRWKGAQREETAFHQTQALVQATGSQVGFIWLPRGRPTFFQRLYPPRNNGVQVVMGNDRKMYKRIAKWHKPPSFVQRIVGRLSSR